MTNGEDISTEIFQPCWDLFDETMRDFRLSVNSSNPRAFGVAPTSYKSHPPLTPTKRTVEYTQDQPDPKRNRTDLSKKGWLVSDTQRFSFPQGLSMIPCKAFSLIGSACTYGRNCSFSHKAFPGNWKMSDRSLVVKWVEESPKISFADSINIDEIKKGIKKHEENKDERHNTHQGNVNDQNGNNNTNN